MKRKLLIGAICVAAVAFTVHCSAGDGKCHYYVNGHDVVWQCSALNTECGICEEIENSGGIKDCVHKEHDKRYKLKCCIRPSQQECVGTSYGLWESIEELTINFINK